MSWSGGSYTKGNAGTGGWVGDASLGIGIEAGRHDTQDDDFATGINQCLNKDGSNSCTGDLNLGGFKPVNLAAGTAAAPAICAGGDVNTGIFSPAADQIGIATNGVERVRIDNTGKVGIGTTAPGGAFEVQTTEATVGNYFKFSADNAGVNIFANKSRGATVGTNTIVNSGDVLGALIFRGANGTDYTQAALIVAAVDGTPGASNDMPGRLVFSTTADGSGSPTERMRIAANGTFTLGLSSAPDFYVRGDGLIGVGAQALSPYDYTTGSAANVHLNASRQFQRSTSSRRYKTNIVNYTHGLEAVTALRPVFYKGINDGDKQFAGLIAEEVHEAGLHEFVSYNADNEPDALQYGNMVALAFKAIQELNAKVEALEARVAELEAA